MSPADLKAYTSRAAALEAAIYTQRKLMDEHQTMLQSQRPAAPQRPNLQKPTKPTQPPILNAPSTGGPSVGIIIVGILVAIGCIAMFTASPELGIFMIIACAIGFGSMLSARNRDKEAEDKARRQYEQELSTYEQQMANYRQRYQYASEGYHNAIERWNIRVADYDRKSSKITQKHYDVLASLENTLQELYAQDVIFPKYRNMVAITTINEYLISGRCYELEGPNGAYNLYEMELRQNIIIGQLSSIINSLEQIKSNQFSLYQELVKANATVQDVLREVHGVKENTSLTAYFAGVTALIEASPKVYISHGFID